MEIIDSLNTIAENVPKVYEAGFAAGSSQGGNTEEAYNQGVEDGKYIAEKDFWDGLFMNDGGYYSHRFCGSGWTNETFKPIYPEGIIQPTGAECMFRYFNRNRSYNNDLVDMTEFCQHFDFSKATNVKNIFENARVKNLTLDFSSATSLSTAFSAGNGGKVDNVILKVSEKCTAFTNCCSIFQRQAVKNFQFTQDSVIVDSIACISQVLNKESIKSFINAISPNVSGKTLTLHKKAVNKAFETVVDANDGENSEEWANLIATKSNWTITLSTAT